MALSVDILQATQIGWSVNALRKHRSKKICHLSKTLMKVWRHIVDEWIKSTEAIASAEDTTKYIKRSVVDEDEGLPCPPWDEAFFATQTSAIDLSELCLSNFFDGMDDDGNPQNSGEFKNWENGRPSMSNQNVPKPKQPVLSELDIPAMDKWGEEIKKRHPLIKKRTAVVKPNKPSNTQFGAARSSIVNAEQKASTETRLHRKSDKATIQKKSLAAQQDKLKHLDDATRLEVAKRKLHERYQEVENAKKQRRIKVVELHDILKRGLDYRDTHLKPANHNWHWANRRPIFA